MSEAHDPEGVGRHYDTAMMLEARRKTRQAICDMAERFVPGMAEEEAVNIAHQILKGADLLRGWHGLHVRFGRNTLKNFGEASESGVILADNDIFFIDIGPVWKNWEGDGGDTFVVGSDVEMLRAQRDVRAVFEAVRAKWLDDRLTGEALYAYALSETERRGWLLNLDMSGHRLSDFPHAVIHKGPLAEHGHCPSPGLWVLEIQIRHPERPFSAFYEDLLLDGS